MKSITRTGCRILPRPTFCLFTNLETISDSRARGLGYGGRRGEGCVGCDGGGRKVDSSTGILSISLSMNSTEVQSATLEYKRV